VIVLAAVLAFATAALVSVEWRERADLVRTIDTDVTGLADIMVQGGPDELARRIADRIVLDGTAGPKAFYRLSDATGTVRAGNLPAIPAAGLASAVIRADVPSGAVLVRSTRLRDGFTLAVGRSLAPLDASLAALRRTFALLAVLIAGGSLLIGMYAARLLARRIEGINAAFTAFDEGERRRQRLEPVGNDEIDRLSRHVDIHLARIGSLLRAQRNISDNIAHELRTPLVHLDHRLLEVLDHSSSARGTEVLQLARADIRGIVALFDTLLDIAMADSAVDRNRAVQLDLSELVADIGDLYRASAEEAGLDLALRITAGIAIKGEEMQLSRLIANLLDNAFKHAPRGSRIVLGLAAGPTIVVEDNGPGVPVEDRLAIFDRFRRSDGGGKGHGLGLALVRVIAARHGLSAWVEDAVPGARFVVAPRGDA